MAVLFTLGGEDPNGGGQPNAQESVAGQLVTMLSCTRPESSLFRDTLQMMMGQSGCDPDALTEKSLSQILLDPQTDLDLLSMLKECGKTLSQGLDSETDTALATTLYFSVVASTLVFHQQKITQMTYEKLEESFALLGEKQWMASELKDLLSQAKQICESKRSKL